MENHERPNRCQEIDNSGTPGLIEPDVLLLPENTLNIETRSLVRGSTTSRKKGWVEEREAHAHLSLTRRNSDERRHL